MTPLRSDDRRCFDVNCQVRHYCERWLQRLSGDPCTPLALTLRKGWECRDEFCDKAIPIDRHDERA